MTFAHRSYKKELLDDDNIPFSDIKTNMQELNFINTWLGGHKITIDGFKELTGNHKKITVCEIGCGGGDNLVAVYKWSIKKHINVTLIGVDIKHECIEYARSRKEISSATTWITSDYRTVHFTSKPDIIFSSLFCHHFTNEQLVQQFQWMRDNSNIGFFVNDLHRHRLAYYSIKVLTQIFSSSYLVKNDAPLSVARGFSKNELKQLAEQANIASSKILWKWAFRFLLIYQHDAGRAI
jgi:2-polyprenyl-3-methyl-5-hydroxy-6-metoxy-1,4-benzoquinol methylase